MGALPPERNRYFMNPYLKRGIAAFLAGTMCLSLAACGKKGGDDSKNTASGNSTSSLAQELGFGYLSDYHDLDVDVDNINTGNVSTANGKLYFAGDSYDSNTGTSSTNLYCADPATGEITQIPTPELINNDTTSQYAQCVLVCPDNSGYWMLTNTYTFASEGDSLDGGTVTTEAYGEAAVAVDSPESSVAETDAVDESTEAEAEPADAAEETADSLPAEEEGSTVTDDAYVDPGYTYTDSENKYLASKYDMTGNLITEIDLTSAIKDANSFYPQYCAQDASGDLLVASDSEIYCFGADGTVKDNIDVSAQYIFGMFSTGDGTVVISYYADGNDNGSTLATIKDGKVSEPITITGVNNTNYLNYFAGSGNTLLASDGTYLYSIDLATGAATKLLSWLDSDINASNLNGVVAPTEDQILVLTSTYHSTGTPTYDLGALTKTPADQLPQRTILTLGAEYLDDAIRYAVIDYNRKSDTYRISLVDYSQYNTEDDYTKGTEQLDRDVITGNCPDIVSLSSGHQDKYIAKGALADMSALIDKDETLSMDDLVAAPLRAYTVDGKLYGLPYSFDLQTLIASTKLVGDRTSWTMSDLASVIDGLDDGVSVMSYTTQNSFLNQMTYQNLNQFVDYANASCSFDSDAFRQLLEAAKKLPADEDTEDGMMYAASSDDEYTQLQNGDLLLTTSYISSNSYSLKEFYNIYKEGHGMTAIGYPQESGDGAMISVSGGLAISAKSANIDAAWDFVKTILSDSVQQDIWGFPITQKGFDEALQEATQQSYYLDENNEKVYYDDSTYIGGTEYTLPVLTQEQIDDFKSYVDGASISGSYDSDIMDIITEEAGAFFSGDKSADDVVKLIQNRVGIYLGETS